MLFVSRWFLCSVYYRKSTPIVGAFKRWLRAVVRDRRQCERLFVVLLPVVRFALLVVDCFKRSGVVLLLKVVAVLSPRAAQAVWLFLQDAQVVRLSRNQYRPQYRPQASNPFRLQCVLTVHVVLRRVRKVLQRPFEVLCQTLTSKLSPQLSIERLTGFTDTVILTRTVHPEWAGRQEIQNPTLA